MSSCFDFKKVLAILFIITLFVVICLNSYSYSNNTIDVQAPPNPERNLINDLPIQHNFANVYPNVPRCSKPYRVWQKPALYGDQYLSKSHTSYDYSQQASEQQRNSRFLRAILIYFPIEKLLEFKLEIKWMYLSWIEMQRHEPSMWRTDVVIFIEKNEATMDKTFLLNKMNCSFSHRRNSPADLPMCIMIEYVPIGKRSIKDLSITFNNNREHFDYLINYVNIFDESEANLRPFYKLIKDKISHYGFTDSILIAFDGYEYFKKAGYDFLIRSDMDVFFTPLFGSWLPRYCNDFYVGRGGFSTPFNSNRIRRAAKEINFQYANVDNLGSTWYSTPDQFKLVSYLTLFGMAYLSEEEFCQVEREGKLFSWLWPDWHYGVLLLYGQSLALNHLIATDQISIVKLENYFDFPAHLSNKIKNIVHIHVFRGEEMFSKSQLKAGNYNYLRNQTQDTSVVKFYALDIALRAKYTYSYEMAQLLKQQNEVIKT